MVARLGAALLAAGLLAGGCAASTDVPDVEQLLVEHYLEPLAAAGIPATVADTCRYRGPAEDERWHLSVELRVAADQGRVAAVLLDEGTVLRQDRQPMIVQQFPGRPQDGWNGTLEAAGDTSVLALVFNNATHTGRSGTVGWSEVCPEFPDATPTP